MREGGEKGSNRDLQDFRAKVKSKATRPGDGFTVTMSISCPEIVMEKKTTCELN